MAQSAQQVSGPDFTMGVALDDVPIEGSLAGRVGEDAVLLSRFGDEMFAVDGVCTHYGAALAAGVRVGDTVRCPLHHACFSLRSGAALRAPAFAPLGRWRVEVQGSLVYVRAKLAGPEPTPVSPPGTVGPIVIVGGGAAGFACAEKLRRLGHAGPLTILSADEDPPYDRPNLSKDYLAGSAPDAWMPLQPTGYYAEHGIDLRLGTEVSAIDPGDRSVMTVSGDVFSYDRLLIATGSEPVRLRAPGFDLPNVYTLRTFADARAIAGEAMAGRQAVIIGSGFIGLEAAAALSSRGVAVDVVTMDDLPMGRTLGADVGRFLRQLHEAHGVRFHFGRTASAFDGRAVSLDNGDALRADFVLLGLGVRPRMALARTAGIEVADAILVDHQLETSVSGIFAAGDVASFPDARFGGRLSIEHWVTAQRQGQTAAVNMLGGSDSFDAVPFFWTQQYDMALRYVGHGAGADETRVAGATANGDFSVEYFAQGALRALLSVGRDIESLAVESRFEGKRAMQIC